MKLKTFTGLYIQVFLIVLCLMLNIATNTSYLGWSGFPLIFLSDDPSSSSCSVLSLLPLLIDIGFCGLVAYPISKLLWIKVKKCNRRIESIFVFLMSVFAIASFFHIYIRIGALIYISSLGIDSMCIYWRERLVYIISNHSI